MDEMTEKKRKLELPARLQALANWVQQDAALADIGTDHGYLPVWLTMEGRLHSAIAGDLREGPLNSGRKTAADYAVLDQIDFRLCSGLAKIYPDEVDTIVIAGMGGENIVSILQAAPWTADGCHTLLLQPMTRAEELRLFLSENGYTIRREQLVPDRGFLYPIMEAVAGTQTLTLGQLYGGACLIRDPLGGKYMIEQILRLQGIVAGLIRADRGIQTNRKADHLRDILGSLMELREEWRHANGS